MVEVGCLMVVGEEEEQLRTEEAVVQLELDQQPGRRLIVRLVPASDFDIARSTVGSKPHS